jgi:hypothetical protein
VRSEGKHVEHVYQLLHVRLPQIQHNAWHFLLRIGVCLKGGQIKEMQL